MKMQRILLSLLLALLAACSSAPKQPPAPTPAQKNVAAWNKLIETNQHLPEPQKLAVVNAFFNRMDFVDDIVHWRMEDYWATPLETVETNGGDCEDFVLGKYFTLRSLQVPDERMRMTYVKAVNINKAHMVLTYYETPEVEPLVLDNLDPEIKRSSRRRDLVPVYSFNAGGLWLAHEKGLGKYVGDGSTISLWQQLLAKMRTQKGPVSSLTPAR